MSEHEGTQWFRIGFPANDPNKPELLTYVEVGSRSGRAGKESFLAPLLDNGDVDRANVVPCQSDPNTGWPAPFAPTPFDALTMQRDRLQQQIGNVEVAIKALDGLGIEEPVAAGA